MVRMSLPCAAGGAPAGTSRHPAPEHVVRPRAAAAAGGAALEVTGPAGHSGGRPRHVPLRDADVCQRARLVPRRGHGRRHQGVRDTPGCAPGTQFMPIGRAVVCDVPALTFHAGRRGSICTTAATGTPWSGAGSASGCWWCRRVPPASTGCLPWCEGSHGRWTPSSTPSSEGRLPDEQVGESAVIAARVLR